MALKGRIFGPYLLLFAANVAFPVVAGWLVPNTPSELIPSLAVSAAWAVPVWAFSRIRNRFSRLAALAWMGWYLIGSGNIIASFYVYGSPFQMSVDEGA